MSHLGRHIQRTEHRPFVRWFYHTYKTFIDRSIQDALSVTAARTREWITGTSAESIFERDWDVLIVLDAARHDEVTRADLSKIDVETHESLNSVASCTWQWIPRTFFDPSAPPLDEVAYLSANPHSDGLSAEEFGILDEPWRYAWSEDLGTVEPRTVTDRAIEICRDTSYNRTIIQYLQPHAPYLTPECQEMNTATFGTQKESIFSKVITGEVDISKAVQGYRETLQQVLTEVALLLSNIDAKKVVITADHGEAFGEQGIYEHPPDMYIDSLVTVPWIETTATDSRTHTPADHRTEPDVTVEQRLKRLGYK